MISLSDIERLYRKAKVEAAMLAVSVLILPFGCTDQDGGAFQKGLGHKPPERRFQARTTLSEAEAIRIAKGAIGELELQKGAPIEVNLRDGHYEVIFANVLPPPTFGSDFAAKVTIDASSGKVLDSIMGAD